MKPNTAIARAPQSRGISASLRRLAVRRAGNVLAASALFALGAASAQAQKNYQYQGSGTTDAPVSGVFSTGFTPTIVNSGTTTSATTTSDTLNFWRGRRGCQLYRHR